MALKKPQSDIPLPEEGNVPARLARIIEIGKQEHPKYGAKEKVWLFFSLPTRIIDAPESEYDGKQHMIRTKPLTMSTHEKADLRDFILALDPSFPLDEDMVSLGALLNKPVWLNVRHNEDVTKKRTYANIMGVMPPVEGQTVGELDTTPFYFDYDNPDLDVWTKYLTDWQKETIQGAVNYRGSAVEEMVLKLEAMSGTNEG